jgi:hypothetical protein
MDYGIIRAIQGDTILSPSLPRLGVRISSDFIYIGDVQYIARDSFHVEEFIFLSLNSIGHVTRLLLVHFEGFLDNREGKYEYLTRPAVSLDGEDYLYDIQFIDLQDYLSQRPNSDLAHAADYIRQRSYTFAGDYTFQRFIRAVGEEQRDEFVILYLERNENPAYTPEDLQSNPDLAAQLQRRALDSFEIVH